jgi:predicted membrane-bound spermidine synthase
MTTRLPVGVFFALFTVSGFAGLIYESIWSHYLKLFLGHAAYAQTLVLAIFMGGMALGSWLVSRYTRRIRDLLFGYAVAELGIGLLAVVFHGVFVGVTGWSFDTVIPALGSPAAVDAFKVAIASLLILPSSILLGSTFPLMSAGIIRLHPESQARTLAWLYFTNSLGAAIGVLASGFVLIDRLGLPGTILTAGLLNVALALVVWVLTKRMGSAPEAHPRSAGEAGAGAGRLATGIAILAFVTGGASFIYEIAWIRMLTMGLGASTHAFEVMLSAFILGMSLGGLALALRPPREGRDVGWLAAILVAKGLFAVLALGAYGSALDFIGWTMAGLKGTEQGYALLNVSGLVSSMMVMLPSAFCAGMTLPLATAVLIRRHGGEGAIGRVYAANTAGCIAGTVFATHVGMEAFGVKGLTGFGAACDVALGVAVILGATGRGTRALAAAAAAVVAIVVAFATIELDHLKMASGVFRQGTFLDPARNRIEFYKDGKTATISVTSEGSFRAIRTNGKPDAGIQFGPNAKPSWDESTMILLAALPLAFKPDAKTIANIGFGSGLTTHSLLAHEGVRHVDTIEIEPAMVEGAKLFGAVNARAYGDPRSHIRIEDAKTFFATHQRRYDVIVSEPSNPWVSGVATLFSEEFYGRIRPHLNDGGLLVQWLQVYEIDFDLVGSILKALGKHFPDYVVYTSQPGDIVVIASKSGPVPPMTGRVFESPGMRQALARVGYLALPELQLEKIASRPVLEPMVASSRYPVNSDYFPVVDQNAAKARFLKLSAHDIATLPKAFVPFAALVDGDTRIRVAELDVTKEIGSTRITESLVAAALVDLVQAGKSAHAARVDPTRRLQAAIVREGFDRCTQDTGMWLDAVEDVLRMILPVLRGPEVDAIFARLATSACYRQLDAKGRDRMALYAAFHARDPGAMVAHADRLLAAGHAWTRQDLATFVLAAMSGRIVRGDLDGAARVWEAHRARIPDSTAKQLHFRVVLSHLRRAGATGSPGEEAARAERESATAAPPK